MGELEDVSSDVLDGPKGRICDICGSGRCLERSHRMQVRHCLEALALELARDASFDFFVDAVDPDEMLRTEWDNDVGL